MFALRVTLCGDGAVGKTSIRKRFMGEGFNINYQQTIGADFAIKKANMRDGTDVRFQIWDLAGQIAYREVLPLYYQGTMGALVIYDCTRPDTYKNIKYWIDQVWNHCGMGKVPIILLGNKLDLIDAFPNHVTEDDGKILAKELTQDILDVGSKVEFLPTSAKTGLNIDEAFYILGETVINFLKRKKTETVK